MFREFTDSTFTVQSERPEVSMVLCKLTAISGDARGSNNVIVARDVGAYPKD